MHTTSATQDQHRLTLTNADSRLSASFVSAESTGYPAVREPLLPASADTAGCDQELQTENSGYEAADQTLVSCTEAPPWVVSTLRPPDDGPPPLPSSASAVLVIRIGEPLGKACGGWKFDINFDIGEGYSVFKEKCVAKFTALLASPDAPKKRLALRESTGVYLKKAKNDSQAKYVELTQHNFHSSLQYRWRLLTTDDIRKLGDFKFEAFLYVQRDAPTEQFHRATACRIKQARVQRKAYEAANAVSFGVITAHHLDVVHARRPESTPFEVPTDNTTMQAIELDRQREDLHQQEIAVEPMPRQRSFR